MTISNGHSLTALRGEDPILSSGSFTCREGGRVYLALVSTCFLYALVFPIYIYYELTDSNGLSLVNIDQHRVLLQYHWQLLYIWGEGGGLFQYIYPGIYMI